MASSRTANSVLDRSIVEGPIPRAVWLLAWPTAVQNLIGGLQGVVDHALVGHYVGYAGNAAIGVAVQIFIVVIAFVMSVFTGMGVLVRFSPRWCYGAWCSRPSAGFLRPRCSRL